MLHSFIDWVDAFADSLTCEDVALDPSVLLEQLEERLVEATGRNLAGVLITQPKKGNS
jgi:hypothetical protein